MTYRLAARIAGIVSIGLFAGCTPTQPKPPDPLHAQIQKKEVADFLKGTVWEHVDLANAEPMRVSGFGLVVNLDGTGDTRAPNSVRDYMIKQMQKHGFGSSVQKGFERLGPEQVLNDPNKRVAIVRVDAFIPPGARKNQLFDVQVSALENSNTTSLNRGILYETDLSPRGADPLAPGAGNINPWARVSGPIFTTPGVTPDSPTASVNQKLSLRYGVVMGRGIAMQDRPLVLKLREPQSSVARSIERRIDEYFQDSRIAAAQNEGEIYVRVPEKFNDNWEHFAAIVMHLYFNPNADFAAAKARQLVEIAKEDRDQAPLYDISYCWEALGKPALAEIRPLLHSDSPDVAYAAARAAASLEDAGGVEAIIRIATTRDHPFQLNAVRTLAMLKESTTQVAMALRGLLDTGSDTIRIEAYKALIALDDKSVLSQSMRERFVLDIVPSNGPPLLYASRIGKPRVALIGRPPQLAMPIVFMATGNQLSIISDPARGTVTIFDRGEGRSKEVKMESSTDVAVLIARLAGEAVTAEGGRMNFNYGDVVSILQQLSKEKRIVAMDPAQRVERIAKFELQALPGIEDPILAARQIPEDSQRPTGSADEPDQQAPDPSAPPAPPMGPTIAPVGPTAEGQRPQ